MTMLIYIYRIAQIVALCPHSFGKFNAGLKRLMVSV